MDHAPGPISARVTAHTANIAQFQIWAGDERAIHTSAQPATTPARGVHKPAMSSRPERPPITCGAPRVSLGADTAQYSKALPTSKRWINSPAPGGPSANVENSRCTCIPSSAYGRGHGLENIR